MRRRPCKPIISDLAAFAYTAPLPSPAGPFYTAPQINGMLLVHLPDGPTAHFRLSNLKLGRDIKGHGRATAHKPELILNHFDTRLGHRVGRMFASLFPQDPQFRGRRVVTFHNQRDFIFVR